MKLRRHPVRAARGFTMIEIAICLAVIGFALVAIIGILPTGLNVQRNNREDTVIDQDATVWMEAIRNGAQGFETLAEHVEEISHKPDPRDASTWVTYLPGVLADSVFNGGQRFANGRDVVALLTQPAFDGGDQGSVEAVVRAISGPASEKTGPAQELGLRYRMNVVVNEFRQSNPELPAELNYQLAVLVHEIKLTISWPVRGSAQGTRSRVYRSLVQGDTITSRTNINGLDLIFLTHR